MKLKIENNIKKQEFTAFTAHGVPYAVKAVKMNLKISIFAYISWTPCNFKMLKIWKNRLKIDKIDDSNKCKEFLANIFQAFVLAFSQIKNKKKL